MKKLILLSLLAFSISCYAQDISGCDSISLKTEANMKAAEPCILKLANVALSQPMTGYSEEAHYARKVVFGWVQATPAYTFSLNHNIMKIFKGDNLLLFNVYVCCLAKAALISGNDFSKAAIGFLVEYVKKHENKVAQTNQVKNLIENWESNTIDQYLK